MKSLPWIASTAGLLSPSLALANSSRLAWAVREGSASEAATGSPLRGLAIFFGLIAVFAAGCLWTRHTHRRAAQEAVHKS